MQKCAVAFYLAIFFNNITMTHAAETERFIVKDIHTITKQLNGAPRFAKELLDTNPNITDPAKNVFVNTYIDFNTIQKNLGTVKKHSFTKDNNGEQYAEGMRFFSCSFANISCYAEATNGTPDESEIAAAIRLAENQFVTRSQQRI